MALLTTTDFNTAAFFGKGGNISGGYGDYQPIQWIVNPVYGGIAPTNDQWYLKAQRFVEHGGLVGLKVLELGCAWGSLVRYMRQLGADAYGLDLSYPISQGLALWPELEPYLIVSEALTYLNDAARTRNEWEAVISRGFIDCFSDADLAIMIPRLNFITKLQQIHMVDPNDDPAYYNVKTLAEWQALPWEAGTMILETE